MHRTNPRTRRPAHDRPRTRLALGALSLLLLLVASSALPGAAARGGSGECEEEIEGRNRQCTEFGTIAMDTRADVRGKPVTIVTDITLDTSYRDSGARWLLFSIRHVPENGDGSPVTIDLKRFETPHGDIITTEVERNGANEINLWVDVLDTPVGIPIQMEAQVGVTDRGAFVLETLVLPFDRGYEPIHDSDGEEASLFSSTLLGVNKETRSTHGGDGKGFLDGQKTPGLAVPLVLLVAVALAVVRRRNI